MTTKLTDAPPRRRGLRSIPGVVYVLGATSLFTDIASEMIMPLRLIFLVQVLATPLALAGLIEGLAESATSLLTVLAGRAADRAPSRRGLVTWGYSISAAAKPLLALVPGWGGGGGGGMGGRRDGVGLERVGAADDGEEAALAIDAHPQRGGRHPGGERDRHASVELGVDAPVGKRRRGRGREERSDQRDQSHGSRDSR